MPVFQVGPPNPARGGQPGFIDPMEAIKDQEKAERFQNLQGIVNSIAKRDAQKRDQEKRRVEALAEKNLSREFRNLERFGNEKSYNEYVESGKWIPKGLSEEATGFLQKTYLGMAEQGLSFFNAEKNRVAQQAVLKNTEALVERVVTKELEGLAKTDPRLVDVTAIMKGVVSGPEAEVRDKIQKAFENSPITLTSLTEEQLQAVIDKTVVNFKEKKETQRRARKNNQIAAKLAVWQGDNPLDYRSSESVEEFASNAFKEDFSLKESFAKEVLGENYTREQFDSLQDIALQDFNSAQKKNNEHRLNSLETQRKAEITDVYTRSQSQSDDLRFIDASSGEFESRYKSFFDSIDENIAKLQGIVDSDPSRAFDAQRTIDSLSIMKKVAQRDLLYKSGLFKSAQKRDGIIGLSKLKISALIQDGIKQGKLQPDHTIEDLENFVNSVFQDLGTITVKAGEFTFGSEWMVEGFPPGEGFRPGDNGDLVDHARKESQKYLDAAIEDLREQIAINALRGVSEGLVGAYGDEITEMIADGNYSGITSLFKEEFGIVSEGFDLDEPDLLTKAAKGNLFKVYRGRLKEFLREQLNKQYIPLDKLPEVLQGVNSSLTQLDPELSGIVFSGKEINAVKRTITTPESMDKALEDIDVQYKYGLRPGGENYLESVGKRVGGLIDSKQWDESSQQFKALEKRFTAINKSRENLAEIEGNPQLAFDPDWRSLSKRPLSESFKSQYYPNFHDSIFEETNQAAAERGRLLDRLNEPSGPNAYFDYVRNFVTETDKFATETGNEVARNFVTQFLADANSKIYKQLSHLVATSSDTRSTEKRKNVAQSLVARLSAAMPDSKFQKEVKDMTNRDFARMSVESSRTELIAGFMEAAGLSSEDNTGLFAKNVLSRLEISDRDVSLILANPEYGDAVLISMFRKVMGGRAPVVTGERSSFSAYLSDWKKHQEDLKKQFQRPGWFGFGGKPDYIEITDTEYTSDMRRLYVYKAYFSDGTVEERNEIDREYGVGVRQALPETEEDFAAEPEEIGEKVAPEGTGIEFRPTKEEVILKEDEVPAPESPEEPTPESPEEPAPPVSEPISEVLTIPELPKYEPMGQHKPLTEDEIEDLVTSLYEGSNNSFRENVQSSVFYAFHPDAFSEGGTMEMAFGSIDMSMVEFVTSYRENSDYYSTSPFQTFGGEGRGDRSKVKSPNGLYKKEDLRLNPLFKDIYTGHKQTVYSITHRVETAAGPAFQGEVVGGVALGAGGAYGGAKVGAAAGAKMLAPLGPAGVAAGGVAGFGIGGLFGYLLGGGTGESIGRALGADKEEQTAYINAFNPQSATPSEIRFMIYSLSRIQEARESGELQGNSYEDLSRFERKILTDLSNIAPDTETFLGDLR